MSSDGEGTSRQNPFPQATGSTGLIATEAAAEQWSIHNLLKFLFLNLESAYAKVFDSLNLPICQSANCWVHVSWIATVIINLSTSYVSRNVNTPKLGDLAMSGEYSHGNVPIEAWLGR